MSIMKIEQELEMISQLVEDKIFRDACNNTAQQIEYSFQQMFNDLKSHYIKKDVGGKKKVNPLKDGLLILSEIVKFFFKSKNKV